MPLQVGDKVRILIDIDEGCYKCVSKGSVGEIISINQGQRDMMMPCIEVRFEDYSPTMFDHVELEVVTE